MDTKSTIKTAGLEFLAATSSSALSKTLVAAASKFQTPDQVKSIIPPKLKN